MKVRRAPSTIEVRLAHSALAAAMQAADRAIPSETGGICIGWRTEASLEIVGLLEIPDPDASRNTYLRRRDEAARVLSATLRAQPEGSLIGYVGEWHSHPAPSRASRQDKRELRNLSLLADEIVGLIVLVRQGLESDWVAQSHAAHHGKSMRCELLVESGAAPVHASPTLLTDRAEDSREDEAS